MIAIHDSITGFHPWWIHYCEKNAIPHKRVNCYNTDIIDQLRGCNALMWHFNQADRRDILFAKQLLFAVESTGLHVFPDLKTNWHFDDKVAQKYLLERVGAALVPSYVFYEIKEAIAWVKETSFPKVFKLRGGAGSANVRLVNNKQTARKLVQRAFGSGFSQYEGVSNLKERWRKFRIGKASITEVLKGVLRLSYPPEYSRVKGRERGYIYFQDFIPDNSFDIRVVVIDGKAFAIKRMIRDNDFRASGSGHILYEKQHFEDNVILMSFDLARKLKTQSLAIDYVYQDEKPLIVEISYGFSKAGYDPCEGYWDESMNWFEKNVDPCGWMVESLLQKMNVHI